MGRELETWSAFFEDTCDPVRDQLSQLRKAGLRSSFYQSPSGGTKVLGLLGEFYFKNTYAGWRIIGDTQISRLKNFLTGNFYYRDYVIGRSEDLDLKDPREWFAYYDKKGVRLLEKNNDWLNDDFSDYNAEDLGMIYAHNQRTECVKNPEKSAYFARLNLGGVSNNGIIFVANTLRRYKIAK